MLKILKKVIKKILHEINHYLNIVANNRIEKRLKKKKKKNERINVVFVCERPSVWESIRSIYELLANNERFNVSLVAIPCKKQLPSDITKIVLDSEGSEEFWSEYHCINGYGT